MTFFFSGVITLMNQFLNKVRTATTDEGCCMLVTGNECIAEVCGEVTLAAKTCTVTIDPHEIIKAFRIVNAIKGAMVCNNKLTVPVDAVRYMSNSGCNVCAIRLINDKD